MRTINMELKKQAINILNKDRISNYAMINLLNNNKISKIEIYKSSVALKQNRSEKWVHLISKNLEELEEFIPLLKNERYFAATNTSFIETIAHNREVRWREDCFRLAYLKKDKFNCKTTYPELTLSDAEIVNNFWPYKSKYSLEYIKTRIKEGVSIGYFIKDKPISWIITQDDGAMGFFHTLKEYRRRGYGEKTTKALINKLMSNPPFTHLYFIFHKGHE